MKKLKSFINLQPKGSKDNGASSLELISIKNRLNKLNIYYLLVTQNEHESGVVYANSPNYGTLRSFSNYVKAIIKEYFL